METFFPFSDRLTRDQVKNDVIKHSFKSKEILKNVDLLMTNLREMEKLSCPKISELERILLYRVICWPFSPLSRKYWIIQNFLSKIDIRKQHLKFEGLKSRQNSSLSSWSNLKSKKSILKGGINFFPSEFEKTFLLDTFSLNSLIDLNKIYFVFLLYLLH